MVALKNGMRAALLAAVLVSSFMVAGCTDDHPGYWSRHHHDRYDRHDRDHDHDRHDWHGY